MFSFIEANICNDVHKTALGNKSQIFLSSYLKKTIQLFSPKKVWTKTQPLHTQLQHTTPSSGHTCPDVTLDLVLLQLLFIYLPNIETETTT